MIGAGKPLHVYADGRQDPLGDVLADPRDGLQPLDLLLMRAQAFRDLRVESGDLFVQELHVSELACDHLPLVRAHPTMQRQ